MTRDAPGTRPTGGTLVYLYAIVPADSSAAGAAHAGRIKGIDGTPARTIRSGELAAVVSDVSSAEFDEGPLNQLMRNLDWLGPRAEAHQTVNAQVFALNDRMLPLSFGTLFHDDGAVERLLAQDGDGFRCRLDALRGCAEWVLALRRDEAQARAAVERESPRLAAVRLEIGASTPGHAYLLRRQQADLVRQECDRLALEALTAVDTLLDGVGARRHQERVPSETERARSGAPGIGRVVARLSALLPRNRETAFLEGAGLLNQEWAPRGHTLDVTGPWPPYRFAGLPAETEAGAGWQGSGPGGATDGTGAADRETAQEMARGGR